jgi:predicted DNA-binding transcriptional regulator AlpA
MNSSPASGAAKSPARYLDADACASRYHVSLAHWRRLVDAGRAPLPVRLGRLVRWSVESLERWESEGCPAVYAAKGGGDAK